MAIRTFNNTTLDAAMGNLVAAWICGQTSGQNMTDEHINGHTLTEQTGQTTNWPYARYYAFPLGNWKEHFPAYSHVDSWDDGSRRNTIYRANAISSYDTFSLAFWAYSRDWDNAEMLIASGGNGSGSDTTYWRLYEGAAGKMKLYAKQGVGLDNSVEWAQPANNTWVHFVLRKTGSDWEVLMNGASAATMSLAFTLASANLTLFTEGYRASPTSVNCYGEYAEALAELTLWDKWLSNDEVAALYNGGKGQPYSATVGPIISKQPSGQVVESGTDVTFAVSATAQTGALTYQWYDSSGAIGGETGSSLTLAGVTSAEKDIYYCVVTDGEGSTTSDNAGLYVIDSAATTIRFLIDSVHTKAVNLSSPEDLLGDGVLYHGAAAHPNTVWTDYESVVGAKPNLTTRGERVVFDMIGTIDVDADGPLDLTDGAGGIRYTGDYDHNVIIRAHPDYRWDGKTSGLATVPTLTTPNYLQPCVVSGLISTPFLTVQGLHINSTGILHTSNVAIKLDALGGALTTPVIFQSCVFSGTFYAYTTERQHGHALVFGNCVGINDTSIASGFQGFNVGANRDASSHRRTYHANCTGVFITGGGTLYHMYGGRNGLLTGDYHIVNSLAQDRSLLAAARPFQGGLSGYGAKDKSNWNRGSADVAAASHTTYFWNAGDNTEGCFLNTSAPYQTLYSHDGLAGYTTPGGTQGAPLPAVLIDDWRLDTTNPDPNLAYGGMNLYHALSEDDADWEYGGYPIYLLACYDVLGGAAIDAIFNQRRRSSMTWDIGAFTSYQAGPEITTQPQDTSVTVGNDTQLTVEATSDNGPITYQWYKDGSPITGATSSTLSIENASETDQATYYCDVTDQIGTTESDDADLTVNTPPQFTLQPISLVKILGQTAVFEIATSGDPDYVTTYQWRKDNVNLAGETGTQLSIASVDNDDEGSYDCVATNTAGSATSNKATLDVKLPPEIVSQTTSSNPQEFSDLTLSVSATGDGVLTYQWYVDDVAISGATSASITYERIRQGSQDGTYKCVVTSAYGSDTSDDIVIVVVDAPPVITRSPQDKTARKTHSATFIVEGYGSDPVTYQWQKNQVDITGETSSSLTVNNLSDLDVASYRCILTNLVGSATSAEARLRVVPGWSLNIEFSEPIFGIGVYKKPKLKLTDPADPSFSVSVPDSEVEFWQEGDVGYVIDAPAGFPLFVGTQIGTGKIWARTLIDGEYMYGYQDIEVQAGYNWGIGRTGLTEVDADTRSELPFAKYSGYNKGVKRPFPSLEQTKMEDAVVSINIAEPKRIRAITPRVVGSQQFDADDFSEAQAEGWGNEYWGE